MQNKRDSFIISIILMICIYLICTYCFAAIKLSDEELEDVTAGYTILKLEEIINFENIQNYNFLYYKEYDDEPSDPDCNEVIINKKVSLPIIIKLYDKEFFKFKTRFSIKIDLEADSLYINNQCINNKHIIINIESE